jgi:transcription elongation factor SPT6
MGAKLRIGKQDYTDLDELIVSHVRAMARKVDELMLHDKFKGTKETTSAFSNFRLEFINLLIRL